MMEGQEQTDRDWAGSHLLLSMYVLCGTGHEHGHGMRQGSMPDT